MSFSWIWLVPPVVGAFIGYVTNMVAIKMLFRPLKEVRFLGIRLPFTPGILPRQRHKLADNIGAMVERELLTPEILKARFRREDVRRDILDAISRGTEKICAAPLGRLFPASGEGKRPDHIVRFTRFIRFHFKRLAGSPLLGSALREMVSTLSGYAGNHSLREILGEEAAAFLEKHLETFLEGEIRRSADRISARMVPSLKTAFPDMTAVCIRFLKNEDIHNLLEIHGRVFLNNAILRLNAFQRFVVSAGQYDKTLHERMPEIVDDLIRQIDTLLADEDVRRRLITYIDERVRFHLSGKDTPERIARFFSSLISAKLDRPLGEWACFLIREDLSGFWPGLERHISEWKGKDGNKKLEEIIILGVKRFLENHRDSSLGELLSIRDEQKEELDDLLFDIFLSIVDEQTGTVLETVNVRTLVRERIDALDMIAVERIVLDVMANQLQWINIFGAILGALIGVFQTLFSWIAGRSL